MFTNNTNSCSALVLTWHWRWQRGLRCRTVLLVATPPAAGRWAGWAAWGPTSLCCWSAGTLSRPAASAAHCSWNTGASQRGEGESTAHLRETQMQMWHFYLKMIGPVTHGVSSPLERGRRGLGSDRSPDPPPQTRSSCGSDRVSPGLRRCSSSLQRTPPSLWCHKQTAGKHTHVGVQMVSCAQSY